MHFARVTARSQLQSGERLRSLIIYVVVVQPPTMPRRIHLFGKKRGDRRSVPPWMGPAGEIAFFAGLVVCGLAAFAYLLVGYLLPEWWANRNFVEATCKVLAVTVKAESEGSNSYRPQVQVTYFTDGQPRGPTWTYDTMMGYDYDKETAQRLADAFQPHREYPCWYNPINPAYVVVVRDLNYWSWLLLLVPMAVVAFGGYKLILTFTSASGSVEWRARRASGATGDGVHRGRGAARRKADAFPGIPSVEDLINSPGTHLAFRLPSDGTGSWRTGGLAAMAVFFGIVLVVLVSSALASGGRASRRLADIGLVIPLVAVQVVLSRHAIKQWLRSSSSGSSRIEVSDHPFYPGETYQIMLVQTGKMKVRRLEVQLICQEEATYSPGTDTRIAREAVYRDVLWRRDFLEIRLGAALEAAFDLQMPHGAMHSFVAAHNRVDWFILVRIRTAAGRFERRFPVCVYPRVPTGVAGPDRIRSLLSP
jgi:hypothetical protein